MKWTYEGRRDVFSRTLDEDAVFTYHMDDGTKYVIKAEGESLVIDIVDNMDDAFAVTPISPHRLAMKRIFLGPSWRDKRAKP